MDFQGSGGSSWEALLSFQKSSAILPYPGLHLGAIPVSHKPPVLSHDFPSTSLPLHMLRHWELPRRGLVIANQPCSTGLGTSLQLPCLYHALMTNMLGDVGRIQSCLLDYGGGYQSSSNIWNTETVTRVGAEDDCARRLGHQKVQHCQFLHNTLLNANNSSCGLSAGTTSPPNSHAMHFSEQCPRDRPACRTYLHQVSFTGQEIRLLKVCWKLARILSAVWSSEKALLKYGISF